jgi:hypothetical protein
MVDGTVAVPFSGLICRFATNAAASRNPGLPKTAYMALRGLRGDEERLSDSGIRQSLGKEGGLHALAG